MCLRKTTKYQENLFPDRTSEYEVGVVCESIVFQTQLEYYLLFICKITLLKRLHVSGLYFLGHNQVVNILYQGNCTRYI